MDPDEWRLFFKPFARKNVALVTIAMNNAELINVLVQRRRLLKKLKKLLNVDIDGMDCAALKNLVRSTATHSLWHLPCLGGSINTIYSQVWIIENKVRELVQRDYDVVAVYVTFETERAQRACLHSLSTGKLNLWRNKIDSSKFQGNALKVEEAARSSKLQNIFLEEETTEMTIELVSSRHHEDTVDRLLAFRGETVLCVKEAAEPNDVRWKDLQVSSGRRAIKFLTTTILMMTFVGWSGFFIDSLQQSNPSLTPLYITITNILVPKICELTNSIESHATEGNRNSSLYIKVCQAWNIDHDISANLFLTLHSLSL